MESDSIRQEAVESLFDHYGIDPNLSKNMGFGVNDRKIIGEYIYLDIFDGSWIEIAKLLSRSESGKLIVGEFWDDYGGVQYIASNCNDSFVSFYFEEESDEMDQDDFDEESYYLEYEKNKEKWAAFIPEIAKSVFE